MSKKAALAVAALACIAAAGGFLYFSDGRSLLQKVPFADRLLFPPAPATAPTTSAPPRQAAIAVEAEQVAIGEVVEDLRAVGTLQPNESVIVATEIAGRVSEIAFGEGANVKAGDVLIQLDATILRAELLKAQSDLKLADANRERAETLADRGSGTHRARDEATAAYRVAQVNLSLAEARLQKSTLTAPFSGVVGLRSVSPGAFVQPGQRIVELVQIDPLKLDFRVSEIHAQRVRVGQTVLITSDAAPDGVYEGAIYAIDPIIDVNGRAIRLRANVPNPKGRLSPGFFVRISVVTERRPDAVVVPESAIFPIGGRTLVYKIVEGRARQADVVLGQRMPGRVEVRKGLARGDIIVTAGQQRLREGAPVRTVSRGV
jgi:membrane fusion protein (multidrug efflux system)